MQNPYQPQKLGFLAWFAIVCVGVFVAQNLVQVLFRSVDTRMFISDWLAMGIDNILHFKIWTLFT